MFKVNNKNTRRSSPERRHWRRSGVIIVNFRIYFTPFSNVSIVNFE